MSARCSECGIQHTDLCAIEIEYYVICDIELDNPESMLSSYCFHEFDIKYFMNGN